MRAHVADLTLRKPQAGRRRSRERAEEDKRESGARAKGVFHA
jgi:hypothetical protein